MEATAITPATVPDTRGTVSSNRNRSGRLSPVKYQFAEAPAMVMAVPAMNATSFSCGTIANVTAAWIASTGMSSTARAKSESRNMAGRRAASAIAIVTGPVRPQPKMTNTPNDAPIACPVAIDAQGSAPTTATITGIEIRLTVPFNSTDRPNRPMPRERSTSPVRQFTASSQPAGHARALGKACAASSSTSRSIAARTWAPNREWSPKG